MEISVPSRRSRLFDYKSMDRARVNANVLSIGGEFSVIHGLAVKSMV